MAAAATFLKEGRLSVSEIAARLGYSCPNHFHAAFKKYYQMTATDTRTAVWIRNRQRCGPEYKKALPADELICPLSSRQVKYLK